MVNDTVFERWKGEGQKWSHSQTLPSKEPGNETGTE